MADPDEIADSRTSLVGRKRAFEDLNNHTDIPNAGDREDEVEQGSSKRLRSFAGAPTHSQPAERSASPPFEPTHTNPPLHAAGWNKGVKAVGGIRTSFGSRKLASMSQFGTTAPAESDVSNLEQSAPHESSRSDFDEQLERDPSSPRRMPLVDHSSNKSGGAKISPVGDMSQTLELHASRTAIVDTQSTDVQGQSAPPSSAMTKSQNKRKNKKKKKIDADVPVEPTLSKKAANRLKKQAEEEEGKRLEQEHVAETTELLAKSNLKSSRRIVLLDLVPWKITKADLRTFNSLSAAERAFLPITTIQLFETEGRKRAEQSRQAKEERDQIKAAQAASKTENATIDASPDGSSGSQSMVDAESDNESGEVSDADMLQETPASILAAMGERELELQLIYFPTFDGAVSLAKCLACAQSDHSTFNCPFMTCQTCGEGSDHVASACPRKQRCGRCRELGHATTQCPERLARIGSEAVPCDLCQQLDHVESSCHMIWRSFVPPSQNVRLIKSLPMDCYSCGHSGHLGPECGLYQGHGNSTFSRENYLRYVNPSGANQAVGTGKDYTIPPKKKSTFNIKGMASDPISLDDSDEEMQGFIHTKVIPPPPKGNIQVGSMASARSHLNHGQNVHSGFGQDRYAPVPPIRHAAETYRYDRERTFSPPPRYDQRSDFPSYNTRGRGDSYQDFQQPPLPRGPPPPMRGGRGGGGQGRGGMPTRSRPPAGKPPAHKKPKGKRGGRS